MARIVFLLLLVSSLRAQMPDSLAVLSQARRWMDSLCAPPMAGRGYTHNGHLLAARYLARTMQALGTQPGCQGSYLQPFDIKVNVLQDASLSLNQQPLRYGYDFICDGFSGEGMGTAQLALCGYATPDEVTNLKLENKIWVLNDSVPPGSGQKPQSWIERVAFLMKTKGAPPKGVIILTNKLTATYAQDQAPFPVFWVLRDRMPKTPRTASYTISAQLEDVTGMNVVATLPGAKADTAIVFSAHYDHMGQVGQAIFAGGNDNASGVAFMLSLARYYATLPIEKRPYTLVFIGFGGEEVNLLGSQHYVQNPCWPLKQTKAVLNFDLMANGSQGIMTVAGKDYPTLFTPLSSLNDENGWIKPLQARENRPISDHYPFTQKGVQALFFYTQGGPRHYHDIHDLPTAFALDAFVNFHRLIISLVKGL